MESSDSDSDDAVVSRVHAGLRSLEELHRHGACERVEQLNTFGNRLATLDGLQRFSGLVELCLSNNQIEELSFHELDPLKQLRVLDLSANRLSSLRGLPLLPKLEELSVAHNRLTSLEGLLRPVKLPKLQYLDLRGNEIASPVALVPLQHLRRLGHLRLQSRDGTVSNPICELEEYPDAMLDFLPGLKKFDEEDVAFLREVSRVRMPKYQSAVRRIQSKPSRVIDGASQTTPGKHIENEKRDVRVFSQSEERLGFKNTRDTAHIDATSSTNTHERQTEESLSGAAKQSPLHENTTLKAVSSPSHVPPHRVVIREVSTNTELDYEKIILERENQLLEVQAATLVREKELLRKETELFAQQKESQETLRHLQGQLASALERTAKLETQATENKLKWSEKISDLERRQIEDERIIGQLQAESGQLRVQGEDLKRANESLSAALKVKTDEIEELKLERVNARSADAVSLEDAHTRVLALEAALKASEQRYIEHEASSKSQRQAHDLRTEKLERELADEKEKHLAQLQRVRLLESQFQEIKSSRDQHRDECLHKDDEIYHLKKSILQKNEEVEELRLQLTKMMERQDRTQQQQQQLYEKQLQASIMQLEMEFRREHQQVAEKLQATYRKYQEAIRQHLRMKGPYESSLKRETLLKEEVQRLSAIIEGDKQKLVDQEFAKRAEYEFRIQRLEDEKHALQDELRALKEEVERLSALKFELQRHKDERNGLSEEIRRLEDMIKGWETKEGDWKAAIRVKDVMLDDQMRLLDELRKQNRKLEDDYQQDTGEFQSQIEDLEDALDDNLQKLSRLQEKYDRVKEVFAAQEDEALRNKEKIDDLAKQIELKNAALELIEGEMDRMRETLSKQDDLFQKRLGSRLEMHREELERQRVALEETETKFREELEAQQVELRQKYASLADDLKDMAAQNTKLRVALEQERKKNVQSDREMRVLLAQLDRERHVKNERLGDIKRLFEQLQQDSP